MPNQDWWLVFKTKKEGDAPKQISTDLMEMKAKLDLIKQGLGTFTGTFEQAFKIGKEGGAVIQTKESFTGLIEKLGLSTDLLKELQSASAGTIDDMKLMSATSTLLAGTSGDLATSLGNATPELLEIAKAANKLNPSLGDTAFLYESIATGVKRASPMILDNLGLTIKIGEANETYAKQLGKTSAELTAEEQKMALLNATRKAGKVLIEQANGANKSATDSYAKLDASIENASNTLKSKLAPALSNAADALTETITLNEKITSALASHSDEMILNSKTYQEYSEELARVAKATRNFITDEGNLVDMHGGLIQENYKLSEAEYNLARAAKERGKVFAANLADLENAPARFDDYSDAGRRAIDITHELTEEEKKLAEATQKLNEDALNKLKENISGDVGKSLTDYKTKHQELQLEISTTAQRIQYLSGLKYLTPDQKKELDDLKTKLGDAQTAVSDLDKEFEDSSKRMLFNMLTTKAASDGLTETEVSNLTLIAEHWGLVDTATATTAQQLNSLDLSAAAFELNTVDSILTHMNGLPRNYNYNITTVNTTKYFVERGGTESQENSTSRGQERVGGERFGSGGQFVIPAGYESHTWPVGPNKWARSGETVTITPPGQAAPVDKGIRVGPVYINNGMDLEAFKAFLVEALK